MFKRFFDLFQWYDILCVSVLNFHLKWCNYIIIKSIKSFIDIQLQADDNDSAFHAVQQEPPNSEIWNIVDQEDTCSSVMRNILPTTTTTTTTTATPATEKKGPVIDVA